ncbi:CBS domain-containing protein [Baekduia soli]|uniref:CBS domain-containing protein n=1 Tax=Baekduia soli TaxID=496014 RepID=A0A5B8UAZ6_9ACTN|nr:CBS domain-containing protein [Baekduia soli]QEC49822.1 CBS domain-containing protein [Baekduia soli]
MSRIHGEPNAPGDELRFALAGPAVTAVILVGLVPLRLALGGVLPAWATALLDYQIYVTAAILVFNLLPAFPLDGGRVLRALLWRRSGDREAATARAAATGRAFGFALIALGVLAFLEGSPGGLWFALVGGFVVVAAAAEQQGAQTQHALGGYTVGDLMTPDPATVGAAWTLQDAATAGFGRHLYSAFPVVDDRGRAVGLLSLADLRAVPAGRRSAARVDEVMARDPELLVEPGLPAIELLGRPAFAARGRAVVLGPDGSPAGLISVTDLERRLRADALLEPAVRGR